MDILSIMIDVLLGVVIFTALFGIIVTSLNNFEWSAVNLGGTIVNLAWVPYIVGILVVLLLVYLVYKYFVKGKGRK